MRLVPALVVLLACNGGDEPTDSGSGSQLTAAMVSTDPAETARSDQDVAMVVVTGSEGASDITYTYTWLSGAGLSWPQGQLQASTTAKGDVWTVTVIPTAGALTGPSATATVTIVNAPPTVGSAEFDPATPTIGVDQVCNPVGGEDPDGDPLTYSYVWHKDGVELAETSNTLAASQITVGAVIQCSVTPNDGEADGNTVSVSGTADNTPPTVTSAAITPTSPISTEDLLCTPTGGADDDGDNVTFVYEWTVNGAAVSETSDTLAASSYVGSDVVVCTAVPYDGAAYGTGAASTPVTIGNAPPVVTQVLISPGAPFAEDTIACTPTGSDPDNTNLTWSYEWTINGSVNAETSNFLAPGTAVYGDVVACTATASDATDTTSLTSATVTVVNSPATIVGLAIAPTAADGQSALTCSHSSTADPDGQNVTVSYAWTVDGNAAGTGATLAASTGTRGQVAVCTATPNDTVADGTPATASLTFDNAPPARPSVAITPTTATSETQLTCAATPATDYDGDTVNYAYTWRLGAAQIGTGATLSAGLAFRADQVTCEATPNDGTTDGTTGTATITIGNTLPTATAPTLTPTTAYEGTTLTCTSGTLDDVDGDTVTPVYRWTVAGTTVSGASATLTGTSFNKDQAVQCHVTPDDTFGQGTEVSSGSVTISNTAPTTPSISLTPTFQVTGYTELICGISTASTDVDPVDSPTYTISWQLDGSAWTGATARTTFDGDTIKPSVMVEGAYRCFVTASDGSANSAQASSNVATAAPLSASAGFDTSWVLQQGTLGQYTSCESVTNGGTTCINPTISYGTATEGIPTKHSGNNYDAWCQQLGFLSWSGQVEYASRTCPPPGGKLFGCSGSDESTWHWCDWADGTWYDATLDYPDQCNDGAQITSITCTGATNGLGGFYAPPSPIDERINAQAACESVYGVGNCCNDGCGTCNDRGFHQCGAPNCNGSIYWNYDNDEQGMGCNWNDPTEILICVDGTNWTQ